MSITHSRSAAKSLRESATWWLRDRITGYRVSRSCRTNMHSCRLYVRTTKRGVPQRLIDRRALLVSRQRWNWWWRARYQLWNFISGAMNHGVPVDTAPDVSLADAHRCSMNIRRWERYLLQSCGPRFVVLAGLSNSKHLSRGDNVQENLLRTKVEKSYRVPFLIYSTVNLFKIIIISR